MDSKTPFPKNGVEPPESFYEFVRSVEFSEDQIHAFIDNMEQSADIKAQLHSFLKLTVKAGRSVIKIGRKILDFLFLLSKSFPALSFGMLFGLVVGAIVTAIPVVGAILGGPATLLAVGLGFVTGGANELKQGDLGQRISDFLRQMSPLAD